MFIRYFRNLDAPLENCKKKKQLSKTFFAFGLKTRIAAMHLNRILSHIFSNMLTVFINNRTTRPKRI